MENNQYMEYTILNPKNGKFHQFVVNDGSDIVQVFNSHLEVAERFESEAYHLGQYVEDNGLKMYTRVKEFTPIEELTVTETKSIVKERFLYTKENIGLLNTMVHDSDKYQSIIKDDHKLTMAVAKLSTAVRQFEKDTRLKITVE